MRNHRLFVLLALAGGLLLGSSGHLRAEDVSVKEKEEVKRLDEKAHSLEKDSEEAPRAAGVPPKSIEQRLEELDQEIRILKRQRELEQEAVQEKAKKTPVLQADEKGFSLKSPDSAFQLKLRGYVQADSRWFFDDDADTGTDGFLLRRVRPIFEGTLFKDFDFRIMPDFGGGSTVLQDAYVGWNRWPEFRLRAGKFKAPVGLERLQSGTDIRFVERAFPTSLLPNRDVGIQAHGELWDGVVQYQAGVFNGVPDGGSTDVNPTDDVDFAGRLVVEPFKKASIDLLQGLGFGIAGTIGQEDGTPESPQVTSYRTAGQQRFFRYRASTPATALNTVVASGDRLRWSPQAYYYYGPFGLLVEYAVSEQEVTIGGSSDELRHDAWQVAASWVLTGEPNSFKSISPNKPFRAKDGGWGAWEVVARYSALDIDNDAFPTFASPTASASKADAWAVGLNWYMKGNSKVALTYEQTTFDGGAAGGRDRPDEKVLFTRFQVNF